MKVLFVVPPKETNFGLAKYPPVGLGYLATPAREKGHRIEILDCVRDKISIERFGGVIKGRDFDLAGLTVWSLALHEVKACLKIIKGIKPRAITVIGGPHPSAVPEQSMQIFPEADFGFRGEAELGFVPFLDTLAQGREFSRIPGLLWRQDGKIRVNPPAWAEDLDSLGFPSWDLLQPRTYFMRGALIGKDTAVLTCTRGCPYSCTFCSAWITAGKKIRRRSIDNILEEIKYLDENFGIKIFDIPDENFTFYKEYTQEFCRAVIDLPKRYEFFLPNGIRLDTLDKETLSLMRRAGFRREVAVGIESGSQRILKLMKKDLDLDMVREKVSLLNEVGFRPIGYFIVGFPTETREDMEKTLRLAIALKLWAAAFTPFLPMPGTPATEQLLRSGELPSDFDFTHITADRVSYAPQGMTRKELDRIRKRILFRFNLRPRPLLYYLGNYDSFKFAMLKIINLFTKGGEAP